MQSTTAWQAMGRRRFALSAWPWRGLAYLVSASVPGVLGLTLLAAMLVVGGLLAVVLIGIPVLLAVGLAGVAMAAVERWRLKIIEPGFSATDPHRPPDRPGPVAWLTTRYREPATWRELGYTLLFVTVLWPVELAVAILAVAWPLALIASPRSPIVVLASGQPGTGPRLDDQHTGPGVAKRAPWAAADPGGRVLVTVLAAAHGGLARVLLAPREEELDRRLAELTRSRERLVNAFEAERRRIERDLHDGAQQRLVALTMSLGLAQLDLSPGPAADQVVRAKEQARLALAEIRELIHGIHPQILTDRGLPAAVADVADRSPIPVMVDLPLKDRLPQAVESTAYFVVCEALANIAKHSGAERAWVHARSAGDLLVLEIGDDGVGGADPGRGSGLAGLCDRAEIVGGALTLSSPAGGPTLLRVELPCTS